MPTDRESLLADIRTNPDDDAPRLAFADWLENHGEADYAAFIRLEIERDQLPYDDPRWKQLDNQAWALKKKISHIPGILGITRRGFYSDIQIIGLCSVRDNLDRFGPRAVRPSILIHRDAPEQTPEEDAAFRDIFASPWVRHWAWLEMQKVLITADHVRAMSEPGNQTGLEFLCISDGADDDAVRALGEVDLPCLMGLGLHEVWRRVPRGYTEGWAPSLLTPAAVHVLADSSLLSQLRYLSLWGDWLGDDELRALADSPRVAGLDILYVWPRENSWAGLRALIESPHLAGLKRLNCSRIELTREMAELLARPDVLPALVQLDINYEETEEHRALLAGRFGDALVEGPLEDSQGL